jgi:hypothetical protein
MSVLYRNLIVDLLTFMVGAWVTVTGLFLRFVLPPRSGGLALWGWTRHEWGDVHFWSVVMLGVLVVVHVALHWAWVCAVISRLLGRRASTVGRRNWNGVAFLVSLIVGTWLLILAARGHVEQGPDGGRHRGIGRQVGFVTFECGDTGSVSRSCAIWDTSSGLLSGHREWVYFSVQFS